MGVMSENLAKGPIFKKLDQRYSHTDRRKDALAKLKSDNASLDILGAAASTTGTHGAPSGERILNTFRKRRKGELVKGKDRAERLDILIPKTGPEKYTRIDEQKHVKHHWFSDKEGDGWWPNNPSHPVEAILREALIQALEVATKKGTVDPDTKEPRGIPIDTYWVCAGENHPFEAFVCWNTRQVTLIILTPTIPRLHDETFEGEERPFSNTGMVEKTKDNQDIAIMAVRRHKETKKVMVRPVRLEDGGAGPIG